jgi:hypothetical protein
MTQNIGTVDRVLRAVVGIALILWAVMGTGDMRWIGWIGVVPLATSLMGWCGAYSLFGISTCPGKRA